MQKVAGLTCGFPLGALLWRGDFVLERGVRCRDVASGGVADGILLSRVGDWHGPLG